MAKKNILDAEIFLIQLETADVLTASDGTPSINESEGSGEAAPSRFFGGSDLNYRGVEKGYEDEEDW